MMEKKKMKKKKRSHWIRKGVSSVELRSVDQCPSSCMSFIVSVFNDVDILQRATPSFLNV